MADKVKLKFLKKHDWDYIFEEVESGEEVVLKIYKDKPFKDSIKVGDIGYAMMNTNWINEWQPLEEEVKEEKTPEPPKEEKDTPTVPVEKPVVSPYDDKQEKILAQSTLKEAVQIYNHNFAIPGDPIDYEKLFEIHRGLFAYMNEGGYKQKSQAFD